MAVERGILSPWLTAKTVVLARRDKMLAGVGSGPGAHETAIVSNSRQRLRPLNGGAAMVQAGPALVERKYMDLVSYDDAHSGGPWPEGAAEQLGMLVCCERLTSNHVLGPSKQMSAGRYPGGIGRR